jgi:hypothetical protein
LIFGSLYLWNSKIQPRISHKPKIQDQNTLLSSPDTATAALSRQGTSDAVPDIEKDLKNTDLNHLDKEMQAL